MVGGRAALGWALIVLSALVWLPLWLVTTLGVATIAGHNALDAVQSTNPLWAILHAPGFVLNSPRHVVFAAYPLIPWIGVTAAGFGLGQIYRWSPDRRRAFLLRLGVGLTVAFLILRGVNGYGDPVPWSAQASDAFTALSFLNTTKYPPSLLFLLMTLGPALVFLGAVDGRTPTFLRPALTFGKVPLFYFLLHLPLIHVLAKTTSGRTAGACGLCLVGRGRGACLRGQVPDHRERPGGAPIVRVHPSCHDPRRQTQRGLGDQQSCARLELQSRRAHHEGHRLAKRPGAGSRKDEVRRGPGGFGRREGHRLAGSRGERTAGARAGALRPDRRSDGCGLQGIRLPAESAREGDELPEGRRRSPVGTDCRQGFGVEPGRTKELGTPQAFLRTLLTVGWHSAPAHPAVAGRLRARQGA